MRRKKKLIWQLYPSYLMVILVSLLASGWYATGSVQSFFIESTKADLHTQAQLLQKQILPLLYATDFEGLDRLCKEIAGSTVTRLTLILPNGKVVGDSEKQPARMDNHRDRLEVVGALAGNVSSSIRYSMTLKQDTLYVAIPLVRGGKTQALLRTSLPLTAIETELKSVRLNIALGGLVIALLATLVCYYISRRISRPIEEIKRGVEQFAKGDLTQRLYSPDTYELAALADSMNKVAIHLANRIETVITQRNEYEAVLASMVEGVVAVDMDERILSVNQAAAMILNLSSPDMKGRSVQELSRNRELHQFVSETLAGEKLMEGDIQLYEEERTVHTQSIPLRDSGDARIGTLLVLNDVTELRRLENVRQDFVANVSHEIKTPLTAIKGFVETLLHGDDTRPEDVRRFHEIINKHVDRLNAIVEDLLALARVEQPGQENEVRLEKHRVRDLLESAVQVVLAKADAKKIDLNISCVPDLSVRIDAALIDQAVVNLIDNAIKYSPANSAVSVVAERNSEGLHIGVRDSGQGIPRKHLPRLFERFYRADKSRSRKQGGTGLGLAIVKHIVQAHGGFVSVDSTPGTGSTFTIHLPDELVVG